MNNRLAQIKADASWNWDDWIKSEADEKALLAGYAPDPGRAGHVRKFFTEHLCHSKGQFAGKPFTLFDWEWDDLIRPLFGWIHENGTRRFKMGYVSVAKKNGKSALMSGLGLYGLIADKEPGAEIFSAAADRDQAGIVFNESANMVEASPSLSSILTLVRSQKRIIHERSRSFYKALSADVPTKEGLNAHYILFDELHAQKTRGLFDTLRYAGSMRRQPLFLMITTAGYDKHSICYEQYMTAKHIQDGIIDDLSFFVYIAEAEEGADVLDEAAWRVANPSFVELFDHDTFAHDAKEAKDSVTKENRFRRYRLNQWTQQDVRWIQMDRWDDCCGHVNAGELQGETCFGGLDLAVSRDLNALVLAFPRDDVGYKLLAYFWAPRENAEERQRHDRVPYMDWANQGLIELTDGNVADYQVIRRRINEIADTFGLRALAVDRVFQGVQLCTELGQDGIEVVPFGQGYYSMAGPCAEFERLYLAGNIEHGGHPILRWMAGNVTVQIDDAGCMKPSKKKSTERIDGIVAAIMAISQGMVAEPAKRSVYATRGLVTI